MTVGDYVTSVLLDNTKILKMPNYFRDGFVIITEIPKNFEKNACNL